MTGLDVDPSEVAAAMIAKALPGFESRVVPARDAVGIRGALPIGAEVSRETFFYPVYSFRPAYVDTLERDRLVRDETPAEREARHAEQRAALERELAPVVGPIVDKIRRLAIEAVGLEELIAERERRARIDGQRVGHELGFTAGKRAGRLEVLAEIAAAAEALAASASDEAEGLES
ncbi:hypothetical protein QEH40_gp45 [Microbacterium phage OscarSo]|uniref:Uncharacterized protein n=1 Tax=Microbacterium phage OscarSo TaxID=2985324 RepID=A0A9X9K2Z6_9CAUD|nr:hypothetical protein QEH40_gp45 [Microbacterium phage OscarSo]UYL87166.1 hypothetical protein SEA_OSCARSO_45 [Microbacterium phage OscarSo]